MSGLGGVGLVCLFFFFWFWNVLDGFGMFWRLLWFLGLGFCFCFGCGLVLVWFGFGHRGVFFRGVFVFFLFFSMGGVFHNVSLCSRLFWGNFSRVLPVQFVALVYFRGSTSYQLQM